MDALELTELVLTGELLEEVVHIRCAFADCVESVVDGVHLELVGPANEVPDLDGQEGLSGRGVIQQLDAKLNVLREWVPTWVALHCEIEGVHRELLFLHGYVDDSIDCERSNAVLLVEAVSQVAAIVIAIAIQERDVVGWTIDSRRIEDRLRTCCIDKTSS